MKQAQAKAAGQLFYKGAVCPKHPKLKGQRRTSNRNCHACIVDRMRARRRKEKAPSAVMRQGQVNQAKGS